MQYNKFCANISMHGFWFSVPSLLRMRLIIHIIISVNVKELFPWNSRFEMNWPTYFLIRSIRIGPFQSRYSNLEHNILLRSDHLELSNVHLLLKKIRPWWLWGIVLILPLTNRIKSGSWMGHWDYSFKKLHGDMCESFIMQSWCYVSA